MLVEAIEIHAEGKANISRCHQTFDVYFPDGMRICHLPFGPTAYFSLTNTVMRHSIPDVGTMSEAYPHLIFHKFESQLGLRVCIDDSYTDNS